MFELGGGGGGMAPRLCAMMGRCPSGGLSGRRIGYGCWLRLRCRERLFRWSNGGREGCVWDDGSEAGIGCCAQLSIAVELLSL